MAEKLDLTFGGHSSAGIKSENQDAFAVWQPTSSIAAYKGVGCCLADGVSCSENAQQASVTAVTHFLNDYYSTPDSWDVKTAAGKVLSSLNSWLYHQGQQATAKHNSLVTTFSAVVFKSRSMHLFHVGDSRVYRLRAGEFECLTRDHTHRMGKNEYLSRALGMDVRVEMDYFMDELMPGDVLLLTSDGVHGFLQDKLLKDALSDIADEPVNQHEMEKKAAALVSQALENQSTDNLTALLIRVNDIPKPDIEEAHRELTSRVIPPVLQPGDKIDHYEVEKVIFSGTRSHLYRVLNHRDQKRYALKAPSLNFEEDLVYLEGFVREQWIGNRVAHPNVMRVEPPLQGGRFMYHVCELIEGQSLRQWIDDNPQPELEVVREIIEQVIHGLRAMQRMGMVHRDMKPENVMITRKGQIKIIDFGTVSVRGLAEVVSAVEEDVPQGTVNYIAPEYVIDKVADSRSDLFSVSVMVYEMLSGALPFRMEKVYRRGAKSASEWKYSALSEHRPDIPKWVDLAIEKGCAPAITDRYEAFSEFWADLNKPNTSLLRKYQERPLLSRAGKDFWKGASAILLVIAIAEAAFIFSRII
ncbi:MAG: bifunctional protein-serine/threonine kinase/phosphatase [Thalassolituus sp.]